MNVVMGLLLIIIIIDDEASVKAEVGNKQLVHEKINDEDSD